MDTQNVTLQLTQKGLQKILTDMTRGTGTGAAGLLEAVWAGLFSAWPGWSEGLLATGLTEAVYGGYARIAPVFGVQYVDPSGRPQVIAASIVFAPTDSSAASRCLGVGLYDANVAGNLYGVGVFDTPITLATPSDAAVIVLNFAMPIDEADWGVGSLVS